MADTPEEVEDLFLTFLGDDYKSPKQIRTKMTKKLAKDPGSAKALAARAWAYCELEEFDDAIADATKAIELCPGAYLPWHVRGTCFWRKDQSEKAEPDLTEAIRLADSVKLFLEDTYLFRGGLRCNDKRPEEAIEDLNQCLKLHPEHSWGYVFRGNAYCLQQKYRKAIKDFEKAIELEGEDAYALSTLACLLATCPESKIRDGQRALELAELANDYSENEYLSDLAAARAELGDFKQAVKIQKRAIKKCQETEERAKLERRLKLFESGQPYHALWDE